jgi:hypothetical protein
METACLRSVDSSIQVSEAADRLSVELDNLTPPPVGIIRPPLDEDDSLMVAIRDARARVSAGK